MSIVAGVGMSNAFDTDSAVNEALFQATNSLSAKQVQIIFVFASAAKYDQQHILNTIAAKHPTAVVVGCSSSGEITHFSGPVENSVVIMAINSDSVTFTPAMAANLNTNAGLAGQTFAKNILGAQSNLPPPVSLIFPDGVSADGSALINGISHIFGSKSILVGGSAADDFEFKKTYQYCGSSLLTNAISGVGLYGQFSFGVGVRHGWIPIGTSRIVTRANGNLLQELDGKPAITMYEDQFGEDKMKLQNDEPFAKLAITYPLGLSLPGEQEFLTRDPLYVTANGEIICSAEVPLGSEVYLMIGSREEAIAASREAAAQAMLQLGDKKPKAAFVFSSVARKKLLMNLKKDDLNQIIQTIGADVPLVGFYSYGEQAPSNPGSAASFHNETNVVFLLGE